MSSANRVEIRYIPEVTWGTTPATPTLSVLRMTGESLTAGIQTKVSDEIRSDRNQTDLIPVGSSAGGNVNFELSPASLDDMIAAAMCSSWIVDGTDSDKFTCVNGVTETSFTLQKKLVDITQYFNFTGCKVNTLSLNVGPNKIITGVLGFMAKAGVRTATQFGSAVLSAAGTTLPFNGAAGVTVNTIDSAAITSGLMNFTLNINNNRRSVDAVGSSSAQAIVAGKFEVSGDLETYFEDGTYYDKFAAGTAFTAQIKMVSGTSEIWIDLPNGKFNTSEVVAQGTDTDVMFKSTYTGLYNDTTVGSLKITKNGPLTT